MEWRPQSALSSQLLSSVTSGGIDRSVGRSVGQSGRERGAVASGGSFIRRGAIKLMIGYLNGRRKERKEKGKGKISSERRMEWNRAFRRRNKLGGGGGSEAADRTTRGFVAGQRKIELREDDRREKGAIKSRR